MGQARRSRHAKMPPVWRRIAALGALLVALAIPLPGCIAALTVSASAELEELPSSTREYATITRHLRAPFDGYGTFDVLVPQFKVVALSHMASGLLNVYVAEPDRRDEVQGYLREVSRRALSSRVSPTQTPTGPEARLDDENLFWSHLALILGIERYVRCEGKVCAQDVGGDTDGDRLQERIVWHLLARTGASGVFHARSYPGSPMWPADQTVTLLAMKLYDVTHATSVHDAPLRGFLRVVGGRADPRTGLFPSSVSPIEYADVPRGCATSWSSLYLAQLDPAVAFDQYTRARANLRETILGVGGFREWPRGRGGGQNVDSGPIVLGVGMAATGLGLGPARIFRDEETYTVIRRTALLFGAPAWWRSGGYMAAPLLGEAILFDGRTARPWFGPAPVAAARPIPAPIAPALFAGLDALAMAWLVRALVRSLRARWPRPSSA
jgi:hypothetical protein